MPFQPWEPPAEDAVELRQLARRIADLTVERTREKNRLHAVSATRTSSAIVINDIEVNDIEVNLRHLERRIEEMVRQAVKLVEASAALAPAFEHVTSVRGIAAKSAVLLLGELLGLPRDMSVREWVWITDEPSRGTRCAAAPLGSLGRSPAADFEGGQRAHPPGAQEHLWCMPAHVAVQREPEVGAFYEQLVERGKPKMVAVVAVMRNRRFTQ